MRMVNLANRLWYNQRLHGGSDGGRQSRSVFSTVLAGGFPLEKADITEPAPGDQARPSIKIDESKLIAMYANFCRVTGTPEELILDFGLNTQPFGPGEETVVISQRIVTNYYTAKRMLHALHL